MDYNDQKQITLLLARAIRVLTKERLAKMLPPPLVLEGGAHDTGIQIWIKLKEDGHPSITAWEGSVWFSSHYDFNDRGKLLGFVAECEFARPAIEQFLDAVECALADAEAAAVARGIGDEMRAAENRQRWLDHYRSRLK